MIRLDSDDIDFFSILKLKVDGKGGIYHADFQRVSEMETKIVVRDLETEKKQAQDGAQMNF